MNWLSTAYVPYYQTVEEVEDFFDQNPVEILITPQTLRPGAWPHEKLLAEMVEANPERWKLVATFPNPQRSYDVFQFSGPTTGNRLTRLSMERTLPQRYRAAQDPR